MATIAMVVEAVCICGYGYCYACKPNPCKEHTYTWTHMSTAILRVQHACACLRIGWSNGGEYLNTQSSTQFTLNWQTLYTPVCHVGVPLNKLWNLWIVVTTHIKSDHSVVGYPPSFYTLGGSVEFSHWKGCTTSQCHETSKRYPPNPRETLFRHTYQCKTTIVPSLEI